LSSRTRAAPDFLLRNTRQRPPVRLSGKETQPKAWKGTALEAAEKAQRGKCFLFLGSNLLKEGHGFSRAADSHRGERL